MILSILFAFTSCNKTDKTDTSNNPFSNGGDERNMIVVISDLHLGADTAFAECKENLAALEKFLEQIRVAPNVKELVIAGDLLDEWFVPAPINTYQGKDQYDFVQRIAATNKGVFAAFNNIIKEGKILVTYVPGNHDLTITAANVESVLPGINQVRDEQLGLGTYSPADCPVIAIEHGHRYNFFCAPDQFSNQDIAPGTIMPPGYFFTRIGALHVAQKNKIPGDSVKALTLSPSADENQKLLHTYWKLWEWSLNYLSIDNKFDEKLIVTNVDGFTGTYSVNDLLPYQQTPGGIIDVNLYKGIVGTWDKRQSLNKVPVNIPVAQAIANAPKLTDTDDQARIQYFMNPNSDKRIVVFGHSHVARIDTSLNHKGQKSIYANSGTWIDHNPHSTTRNFVVITPQNKDDDDSQTFVKVFYMKGDTVTKIAESSLRY